MNRIISIDERSAIALPQDLIEKYGIKAGGQIVIEESEAGLILRPSAKFPYDPKARPIWEVAAEISAQIPDSEWAKVPTDLAKNFDKYQTETVIEDGE